MRTIPRTRVVTRSIIVPMVALVAVLFGATGPALAQYGGGGITFFPEPRVPVDQEFSVTGTGCAAGETVEITIDGVPGVLATTTASAAGNFSIDDIDLPDGLIAGSDIDARATCGPLTTTGIITLLCPSGDLPVDGSCEDGSDGIVGGSGPTTTTTSTTSTTTTTTTPATTTTAGTTPDPGDDGGGDTTGGVPSDDTPSSGGGSSPDLAITGASFTALLVQGAVTLFAGGFLLLVVARRRRNEPATA